MKLTNFINLWVSSLFLIVFLNGCDIQDATPDIPDDQFEPTGIEGAVINSFKADGDQLYAVTNNGVWVSDLTGDITEWNSLGLEGLNVVGLANLSDGSFLAGVQRDNVQSEEPVLYRQEDDSFSEEWEPYDQNFGGSENYNYINRLEDHPDHPGQIYARGAYSLARSIDDGESWQTIFGDWSSIGYLADLLEFDPGHSGRIWIGGESAAFQPYLYFSDNEGESWNGLAIDASGDNAVYSMAFHPDDVNRILVGLEGEIRSSDDLGETWTMSFENDLYHYILAMSTPNNIPSETVYASGSEYGAQGGNLFFLVTNDFGETWEKFSAEAELDETSINDLYIHEAEGQITIYLGTSLGVWSYRMSD